MSKKKKDEVMAEFSALLTNKALLDSTGAVIDTLQADKDEGKWDKFAVDFQKAGKGIITEHEAIKAAINLLFAVKGKTRASAENANRWDYVVNQQLIPRCAVKLGLKPSESKRKPLSVEQRAMRIVKSCKSKKEVAALMAALAPFATVEISSLFAPEATGTEGK